MATSTYLKQYSKHTTNVAAPQHTMCGYVGCVAGVVLVGTYIYICISEATAGWRSHSDIQPIYYIIYNGIYIIYYTMPCHIYIYYIHYIIETGYVL